MRLLLLCVTALVCTFSVHAQYSQIIESDRPGEGRSAFVQSFRSFQSEFGFRTIRHTAEHKEYWHPAFALRYGITNWLEGRVESMLLTDHVNGHSTTGIEPVNAGVKALILPGDKWIPHLSVLAQTGLPFLTTTTFQTPHLSPELRLLFENEITDALVLNYNTGVEWDGNDPEPQYMYSLSPQITVANKVELFVEIYGFMHIHDSPETTADAGASYFLSRDVKVDLSAGWGLSHAAPAHFCAVGISARLR